MQGGQGARACTGRHAAASRVEVGAATGCIGRALCSAMQLPYSMASGGALASAPPIWVWVASEWPQAPVALNPIVADAMARRWVSAMGWPPATASLRGRLLGSVTV